MFQLKSIPPPLMLWCTTLLGRPMILSSLIFKPLDMNQDFFMIKHWHDDMDIWFPYWVYLGILWNTGFCACKRAIFASIRSCSCNCRFAKVVKAAKSLLELWAWPWLMVKWWNMKELCFAPAAALPFKSHSWTHGIVPRPYPWSQCVVTSVHLKIWRIIDRMWWDTSSTSGSLTSCSQSSWAALLTQSSKPSALRNEPRLEH